MPCAIDKWCPRRTSGRQLPHFIVAVHLALSYNNVLLQFSSILNCNGNLNVIVCYCGTTDITLTSQLRQAMVVTLADLDHTPCHFHCGVHARFNSK